MKGDDVAAERLESGSSEPSAHLPGVLRSRYRVERRLRSGLHGPAWILHDTVTAGQVALRYLAATPTPAMLFAAELRHIASLVSQCPGAVRILDAVEEGAAVWLVREWIAGESLSEALATLGTFNMSQVLTIFSGIHRGLLVDEHDLLIHGHLCPENVLIRPSGAVYVSDHGLRMAGARAVQPLPLLYLAPEIVAGETPTWRSDVYAFGALLYVALCGHYPLAFEGRPDADRDVLRRHEVLAPPSRAGLKGHIGHVIWRALQPQPTDRFATVSELMKALEAAAISHAAAGAGLWSRLFGR